MGAKKDDATRGAETHADAGGTPGQEENPSFDMIAQALAELAGGQQLLELPVRVVDPDGRPVANARVTPWALRSSRGHGLWREDDERVGVGPEDVVTAEDGTAVVRYPRYHDVEERIRATAVSLFGDHPDFAYVDKLHIDVPPERPYEIELTAGVPIEVRPLVDGGPTDLDHVFALWSDGRSWRPGAAPEKSADGTLRIPSMPPGENSVLLVKLDGDRATHFSELMDFVCDAGTRKRTDVVLRPAVRIEGILSDNVPRPVREGRIQAETLAPAEAHADRVEWLTWVPIQSDGSFTIDGWPAGEPVQLIAVCDGYIAAKGREPDVVQSTPEPENDPRYRPQVFNPVQGERIEVAMTPLARCVVRAVDEKGKPVAGVTVSSCPNVFWWNGGSQVYCHPLVRGERLLRARDYFNSVDKAFPPPFLGETDADGKLALDLPAGNRRLHVSSGTHELPVSVGRRHVSVKFAHGEKTESVLRLQPRASEKIGEWDTLIDVVFGEAIRQCPGVCSMSAVWEKMDEFVKRYRAARNQPDPRVLSDACSAAAEAFEGLGNRQEAARWRQKAAEQVANAVGPTPAAGKNETAEE